MLTKTALIVLFATLASSASVSYPKTIQGIVEDVFYCGGLGFIRELRITSCTSQPCLFEMGKTYDVEIDFIPSRDSNKVNLDVSAYIGQDGGLENLFSMDFEGEIIGQESYTLTFPISIPVGDPFDMRLQTLVFIRGSHIEICGEIDTIIRP